MPAPRRRFSRFLLPEVDWAEESLYEFKGFGRIPASIQATSVVGLFVATVLLTHSEYKAHGTAFGFPGPGFNVLIAPIYEELIFRGWILGSLVRKRSVRFSILISSFLFGLVHIRNIYWLDFEPLFGKMIFAGLIFGPIAGYLTLRARSLWPAVILHYLNNLTFYLR
ncbi:MAG: CPBP family intramembrane metalloprotease [Planctomycetota bacterium]|nr:MAG: CPBP family intramembrane metalloprotease [Planctomycetota bacterium]